VAGTADVSKTTRGASRRFIDLDILAPKPQYTRAFA